jgi:putative redox protein
MSLKREKIEFQGHAGKLAGLLETPAQGIKAYVLFAHCFTCGKDIAAASRISRSLVKLGFAVMRFDFSGLGNSDGDFANTSFSSNVTDLVAAAEHLRQNYQAPKILIGHSLGGTAILKAAAHIPESQAVVSIGSPSNAEHVAHLFSCSIDEIQSNGEAEVDLAGRKFTIKKQFIDDINNQSSEHIGQLRKALLVLHSPVDILVPITEAEKIYHLAKHPKSFISLDQADHMLSKVVDAEYAAHLIAAWSEKYIEVDSDASVQIKKKIIKKGHVEVSEINHKFLCDVQTSSHQWQADEPVNVGGNNQGADPYSLLLSALGACTVMTLRMYANLKKIPLQNTTVDLTHRRDHGQDCGSYTNNNAHIDVIERRIKFSGDLTESDKQRLLIIADKCPVHKTLTNTIKIMTQID